MSKLKDLFDKSNIETVLNYIKTNQITKEDMVDLFREYGKGINSLVLIDIIKYQKLDSDFIEEFKELLNWNMIFQYQDLEFELYEKNIEILKKYNIEELIKNDKIKTTEKEKNKFITYFKMKK